MYLFACVCIGTKDKKHCGRHVRATIRKCTNEVDEQLQAKEAQEVPVKVANSIL